MNLEHHLRHAFRRQPAPPDFANRVLARLDQGDVLPATATSTRLGAVPWLAAAAASIVIATGGAQYYVRQQTVAEAERVQQQVRLALQIAGEKLALVQRKLQDPTR